MESDHFRVTDTSRFRQHALSALIESDDGIAISDSRVRPIRAVEPLNSFLTCCLSAHANIIDFQ